MTDAELYDLLKLVAQAPAYIQGEEWAVNAVAALWRLGPSGAVHPRTLADNLVNRIVNEKPGDDTST